MTPAKKRSRRNGPASDDDAQPSPPKRRKTDRSRQSAHPGAPAHGQQQASQTFVSDPSWTDEAELQSPEDQESQHDKPIRWLDEFVFFDPSTNQMQPIDHVLNADGALEGVGLASEVILDEWDDESNSAGGSPALSNAVKIKLGAIFTSSIDLGAYASGDSPWNLDSNHIWVQTQYAFYVLRKPAKKYLAFYKPFYIPRRAVQLIAECALDRPGCDRKSFEKILDTMSENDPVLGCRWSAKHFRDNNDEICHILAEELDHEDHGKLGDRLARVKLVRSFLGQNGVSATKERDRPASKAKNGKTEHDQVVSTIVGRLARPFFRHSWTVVPREADAEGDDDSAPPPPITPPSSPTASDEETEISLEEPFEYDPERFLKAIVSAGTDMVYRAHDIVKVRGEAATRGAPDVWWFGRIAFFVEDATKKALYKRYLAHIEWFNRSDLALGLPGCPEELFALLRCDEVPLSTLDGPPVNLVEPAYPMVKPPLGLFCTYLHDGASFTHLAKHAAQRNIVGACFVCNHEANRDRHTEPAKDGQRVRKILGVTYHIYDFVYLRHGTVDSAAAEKEGVSVIARILAFTKKDGGVVRVQVCERSGQGVFGQRELRLSTKRLVPAGAIVTRCRVVFGRPEDELLLQEPDMFFLDVNAKDVAVCEQCARDDDATRELEDAFDDEHNSRALRMLDPYSGPGGLSLGIERGSRCIRSSYAVDLDESTAKTFQANSNAVCFQDDANHFLESIVTPGSELKSVDGREHLLRAGRNFNVDVICAGVPCQGHSTLNIHRGSREGEHNNQQMLTALSLVEVLRPRYLCIENVPAIGKWALKMRRGPDDDLAVATDPHGGLRLTITILLALGYQVRVGILQAGNYGTPQCRRRFILLAAESGSTLPDLPRPTTAFESQQGLTLKAFPTVKVPWRVADGEDGESDTFGSPLYVPHRSVTVGDAIGDLSPFDWSSDARPDGASSRVDSFPCDPKKGCQPKFARPYACDPQHEYQLRARHPEGVTKTSAIQHVTAGYPAEIVRKVCSMARTDADYRGMGSHRKADYMISDPVSSTGRKGFAPGVYYRRLNEREAFSTLVTRVHPTGKQSQVIHPTQNRLISVREMARGQGFPDTFRFEGTIIEMQHQLGNAVPVPLGEAIGRQIRAAMFKDWCEERDQTNPRHTSPEL